MPRQLRSWQPQQIAWVATLSRMMAHLVRVWCCNGLHPWCSLAWRHTHTVTTSGAAFHTNMCGPVTQIWGVGGQTSGARGAVHEESRRRRSSMMSAQEKEREASMARHLGRSGSSGFSTTRSLARTISDASMLFNDPMEKRRRRRLQRQRQRSHSPAHAAGHASSSSSDSESSLSSDDEYDDSDASVVSGTNLGLGVGRAAAIEKLAANNPILRQYASVCGGARATAHPAM